jgi:hypothetical protein
MPLFKETANGTGTKVFTAVYGGKDLVDLLCGEGRVIHLRPVVGESPGVEPYSTMVGEPADVPLGTKCG